MSQKTTLTRANLKTPKAAAIAGIVFSILLLVIFGLLRASVPADPSEPGAWLATSSNTVALALNLIPLAGIAFLWFIGVLRDRLGELEDRFFSTVFFGSALLFLAMLFASGAVIGALIMTFANQPSELVDSATFHFARAVIYNLVNVYAIKMVGVFMISTSTVAIYTGFAPRWIAILGYALALILLFGSYYITWSILVVPVWVLLVSVHILVDNFRHPDRVRRRISK
jgi:hypothetical protein